MRLIDADALKEVVNERLKLTNSTTCKIIDEQPTVEERKHGHWVVVNDKRARCSVCGSSRTLSCIDQSGEIHKKLYHYCDWCGAKLDGKDESDE